MFEFLRARSNFSGGVRISDDPGLVEHATRSELRRLRCSLLTNGMAATAVSLAQQIDNSRGAVAAAAAAAQLRLILADLAVASERSAARKDTLDELNARRAVKRAAG